MTKSDDPAIYIITSMSIQTDLDDTKSYYQLIIKITISEERRTAKIWKKGKICIKKLTKEAEIVEWLWLVDLTYNFEYDWLI